MLDDPCFVAYLDYLRYFAQPGYSKFLTCVEGPLPKDTPPDPGGVKILWTDPLCFSYPAPTLKALELLQQERFRRDILSPDTVARLITEMSNASLENGTHPLAS